MFRQTDIWVAALGMVLDAEDCEVANGTVVRQRAQLDNVCQQWDIAPASGG